MTQRDHVRFVVGCISGLCAMCAVAAVVMVLRGYDSGGAQMTMAINSGISGLVGFLGRGLLPQTKNEINNQGPTEINNQPTNTNETQT